MIDVVIPARNEADTIGGVIEAFRTVDYIGNIIVAVNPPTDDRTALAAKDDALVIRTNEGKGEAITAALDLVETDHVVFCDGDLTGLTPEHVRTFTCHCPWMTVGVPDFPARSPVPWPVRMDVFAQMSGQRCLPTWLARQTTLHGYTVEVFLNREADRMGVGIQFRRLVGVKGKVRENGQRMAELRRDRVWMQKNW